MAHKRISRPRKMAGGGSIQQFLRHDLARRTGGAGDAARAAIQDRLNEGALVADLVPDALHPLALPLFGLAAGGYELAKGVAGPYLPGPFRTDESSSPASAENVLAALKGFTDQSKLAALGARPVAQDLLPIKRQRGGQVPSNKGSNVRVPAKWLVQKYAQGGQVKSAKAPVAQPQNVVGSTFQAANQIAADPSAVNQTANQLANFQPGIQANTGQMLQTANRLGQFDPLTGTPAGNTLQGFIQSGNAVDVNPLVQAAQTRAQQGFGDFMGQANESFGALGLGSSSARTAAMAREAGRLQGNIAATGLEAGVGAEEAARQRQLQAFNPLLQGSGQQLSGLQSAGGLQGQAAGLDLSGQTSNAGMRLSGLQSAGGLRSDVMNTGLQGQVARAGQLNNLSGTLVPPTVSVNQQPGVGPGNFGGGGFNQPKPQFGFGGFGRAGFATGGVVRGSGGVQQGSSPRMDLGDFLGNLTFGQTFTRPPAQDFYSQPSGSYSSGSRGETEGDRAARNRATFNQRRLVEHEKELAMLPYLQQKEAEQRADYKESGAAQALAQALAATPRSGVGHSGGVNTLANAIAAIGVPAAHRGLMQTGQLFGRQSGSATEGGIQRQLGHEQLLQMIAANSQKRAGGGVIEGPSVPPDQVPILAQGGEGVIPVKLMHKLENAKQTKQLAAVAREIQQLMGKEPQLNDRDIQRKARGGKIAKVMGEFKAGSLRSGGANGPVVTDRKQAIAIALSEAKKMAHGGLIQRSSAFEPMSPMPGFPTSSQRDFSGAEGTFPSGATVDFGNRFSLQGDPNKPAEVSPGRNIDPTEDAEMLYDQARAKSHLLRTLAVNTPRGAMDKFAPLIGDAEVKEAAALKNLQFTQDMVGKAKEAEAGRTFDAQQNELNRKNTLEQQRIASQGQVGAASARNSNSFLQNVPLSEDSAPAQPPPAGAPTQQGSMMGAPPAAAPAPNPVAELFSIKDPAQLESVLAQVDWNQVAPDPQVGLMARERVKQLMMAGVGEEELNARYANLYRLAGVR